MKLIMILAASLLPFLHETRYPAEVKGCDAQGITLSAEGELFHAAQDDRSLPVRSYLVYAAVLLIWAALFWQLVWKHRFRR